MALVKFKMIESDFRYGERQECSKCPVALMFIRILKRMVVVTSFDLYFLYDNTICYKLPTGVRDWIMRFDRGWYVDLLPEFEMEIPDGELS